MNYRASLICDTCSLHSKLDDDIVVHYMSGKLLCVSGDGFMEIEKYVDGICSYRGDIYYVLDDCIWLMNIKRQERSVVCKVQSGGYHCEFNIAEIAGKKLFVFSTVVYDEHGEIVEIFEDTDTDHGYAYRDKNKYYILRNNEKFLITAHVVIEEHEYHNDKYMEVKATLSVFSTSNFTKIFVSNQIHITSITIPDRNAPEETYIRLHRVQMKQMNEIKNMCLEHCKFVGTDCVFICHQLIKFTETREVVNLPKCYICFDDVYITQEKKFVCTHSDVAHYKCINDL